MHNFEKLFILVTLALIQQAFCLSCKYYPYGSTSTYKTKSCSSYEYCCANGTYYPTSSSDACCCSSSCYETWWIIVPIVVFGVLVCICIVVAIFLCIFCAKNNGRTNGRWGNGFWGNRRWGNGMWNNGRVISQNPVPIVQAPYYTPYPQPYGNYQPYGQNQMPPPYYPTFPNQNNNMLTPVASTNNQNISPPNKT